MALEGYEFLLVHWEEALENCGLGPGEDNSTIWASGISKELEQPFISSFIIMYFPFGFLDLMSRMVGFLRSCLSGFVCFQA